ncbi:MAG: glycosyltransferase family 4 protein, partial [Candidatus Aenigmatarchaeota archaeon]
MAQEVTVLMWGQGYPGLDRIPYYGGLDDMVEGISGNLPGEYMVHVLVSSCGKEGVVYRPKKNVLVYGSPAIPFAAGEDYAPFYLPLGRECDKFTAETLDSGVWALKNILPEVIDGSETPVVSHVHDYSSGPLGRDLKKCGVPFVYHVHLSIDRRAIDPYYSNCHDLRQFYEKLACEESDMVIAVSEDTKNSLLNAYD